MGNSSRTVTLNVVADGSKASQTLDGLAGKAESSTGRFGRAFGNLGSLLGRVGGGALGPFSEALGSAQDAMSKMTDGGNKLAGSALKWGAGIAAVGVGLTALGDKDKAAQQQLRTAIENTGNSWEDYKDKVEHAIHSQAKFGNNASETMNALQTLTQSTNSPQKALQYLSVAADLAAAKHESLTSAATTLSTVLAGKGTRALAQFGIAMQQTAVSGTTVTAATKAATAADDAAAKAKEHLIQLQQTQSAKSKLTVTDHIALENATKAVAAADVKAGEAHAKLTQEQQALANSGLQGSAAVDQLAKKLHGQAASAADTMTGKLKALKTEVENGVAAFGSKYGPAITGVGSAAAGAGAIMDLFSRSTKEATTAIEAGTAATEGLTVAEDAEDVAEGIALAPILLIIAAIAVLGIGIYELVTHWQAVWSAIKDTVKAAVDFVTGLISGVVAWISGHWQLLLAILTGPFGLLVGFVKDHFNQIVSFIQGIPGAIGRVAVGIGKALANGFIDGINGIVRAWDWLVGHLKIPGFTLPFGLGSFGGIDIGSGLQVGTIPHLASGGIVTAQTLAMLGEGGKKEAVVPLDRAGEFGFGGGGQGGGQMGGDVYLDGTKVGKVLWQSVRGAGLRVTGRNAVRVGLA